MPTQKDILFALSPKTPRTVNDIQKKLGGSHVSIRHQLTRLLSQSRVARERTNLSLGGIEYIYTITNSGLGRREYLKNND